MNTKKQYVDKTKVPKDNDGWRIAPLPLLTCEGNGGGGGDFYVVPDRQQGNTSLIGTWARDYISIETKKPKDYKELKIIHTPEVYQLMYAVSPSYEIIEDYKFSLIEFIFFKFYYLLKYKDRNNNYTDLYNFFDNLSNLIKPNYLKYIKIFIFVLTYKINLDEIPNMVCLLIEYKYNYKNNYELYLEYLHNLFFYGFFLLLILIKSLFVILKMV